MMLGRPRQFDEVEVLDRAMQMFWNQGYEATSTRELAQAMGISQQSLYNTFGNKHQLYLRTLDHYQQNLSDPYQEQLNVPDSSLETIRHFLYSLAKSHNGANGDRRSCFMANSTMELAAHDDDVREKVRHHLELLEERFRDVLEREAKRGRINPKRTPQELARFLTGVVQGLHVLAKAGYTEPMMRQHIDVALVAVECST